MAKYQGCPVPDTDNDGMNDEEDKCPTVAGVARYQGCPVPDTDKDGINDEEDKCPTVAGIAANNGCPEVSKEIIATRIQFETASSKILPSSFKSLDEVVSVLNTEKNLKLAIDGHTDNVGDAAYNLNLGHERAFAVKKYFIGKGIEESRMTTKGYGEESPLVDNNTAANRQQNRRVTMRLVY